MLQIGQTVTETTQFPDGRIVTTSVTVSGPAGSGGVEPAGASDPVVLDASTHAIRQQLLLVVSRYLTDSQFRLSSFRYLPKLPCSTAE